MRIDKYGETDERLYEKVKPIKDKKKPKRSPSGFSDLDSKDDLLSEST
jgi:hypothetical protein